MGYEDDQDDIVESEREIATLRRELVEANDQYSALMNDTDQARATLTTERDALTERVEFLTPPSQWASDELDVRWQGLVKQCDELRAENRKLDAQIDRERKQVAEERGGWTERVEALEARLDSHTDGDGDWVCEEIDRSPLSPDSADTSRGEAGLCFDSSGIPPCPPGHEWHNGELICPVHPDTERLDWLENQTWHDPCGSGVYEMTVRATGLPAGLRQALDKARKGGE